LVTRAMELEEPRDRTTRATLEMVANRASGSYPAAKKPAGSDAWAQLVELASNDTKRIKRALERPLTQAGVALAIPLLAKPELAEPATRAVSKAARGCLGQLADALADPALPVAARTKLPNMIVAAATDITQAERVRAGLMACLYDRELEVRARVAEALAQLREVYPDLALDETAVFEGVRRELAVGDAMTPERRAHLATLLALALPAEPVRTAFHGLHSDDATLRGVALEYLENVLPGDIRERLWIVLAIEVPALAQKRPVEDVLAELLQPKELRTTMRDVDRN
jgi:hypothetical protein